MTEIDLTTFAAEAQEAGEALSPVRAGLLLARECAYPDLRPSDYLIQIEDLAAAARPRVAGHAGGLSRGLVLADYLFQEAGFRGNQDDYADPRNSYLNQVLERRLGLPITLSVIFMEVGRLLRLRIDGVSLPGHFIVAVEGDDGPVYLDPFHGGRRLTRDDCVELVRASVGLRGEFDPNWLRPAPPRAIVQRMLVNLRNFYLSVEDWPLAIKVAERLSSLQPATATHLRDLAVLYYRSGALRRAYDLLEQYLARAPQAPDVASVRQSRDLLMQTLARLN